MPDLRSRFDELLRRLGEISDLGRASSLLELGRGDEDAAARRAAHGRSSGRRSRASRTSSPRRPSSASSSRSCGSSRRRASRNRSRRASSGSRAATTRRRAASRASCEAEMTRAGSLGYRAWLEARDAGDFEIFASASRAADSRSPTSTSHATSRTTTPTTSCSTTTSPACGRPRSRPSSPGSRTRSCRSSPGIGEPVDDSCLHGDFAARTAARTSPSRCSRGGGWTTSRGASTTPSTRSPPRSRRRHPHHGALPARQPSGILSCLHEFGHGLYERQVDEQYARTPLAAGASSAFHESQSRLWENIVGPPALDVALLLSAIPGDIPGAARGRAARGVPSRAQQASRRA